MKNVKPYTDADASLSEIYSTGFQLAFTSYHNQMCHAWVLCKDFMADAVWSQIHGKPVSIYSFKYNPKKQAKISFKPVKVIVRDKTQSGEEHDRRCRQSIKFLNIVERLHGFPESRAEKVKFGDTDQNVWMFTCPTEWVHASPMLSLLTLYIRIGCFYPGGGRLNAAISHYKKTVTHNDAKYLKQCRKLRLLILKKGISIFQDKMEDNYPDDGTELHTIHHQWGIVNSPKQENLKKLWELGDLEQMGKKKPEDAKEDVPAEIAR